MKVVRRQGVILALIVAVLAACFQQTVAAPAPPQAPKASFNLAKEINDRKGAIQWKTAPSDAIPGDVCRMLTVCAGPSKIAVLPVATEGSQKIQRALFLSPTGDKQRPEALVLERRTNGEVYFWLVSPDGELQKTAYIQIGGKSWVLMSNSLTRPTFDKDRQAWHVWAIKPAPQTASKETAPAGQ